MTDARAFESKAYEAGRVAHCIFGITHVVNAEIIMSTHDDGFLLSFVVELDDNGIERNVPKITCLSRCFVGNFELIASILTNAGDRGRVCRCSGFWDHRLINLSLIVHHTTNVMSDA